MSHLTKEKVEFALCNSNLEAKLSFTNEDSMNNWVKSQTERHGVAPNLIPCRVTTRIEVEMI